ncbi:hypothetical protein [Nocardioides pantholopis]|uniref:hypothetical protein n=1 Tax=Nocardioides pantholopis TaxID=2483798 RepID=UPI0013E3D611|nr:hypothetical protein [Nocardioides pantholopis]
MSTCTPGRTAPTTAPDAETIPVTAVDSHQNRSNAMNLMNEDLARAQMAARLGEAQERRRGHQVARAARLSRKAEKAAQQARLALARAL